MNSVITSSLSELDLRFLSYLEDRGRANSIATEHLHRLLEETSDRLAAVVLKLGLMAEEDLARAFAEFAKLPLLLEQLPHDLVPLGGLSISFLRAHEIVPIASDMEQLHVACWDPLDDYAVQALEFASGLQVARFVATRTTILSVLDALYPLQHSSVLGADASTGVHEDEEIDRLKDLTSEAPVIRWVQRLINAAVAARASDIHLEPSAEALHVRLRTDGLLREQERQAKDFGAAVISRIKVMAGLDIAERRLPQDGRIRLTVQGKEIDFRVATSPTLHGESVVLRILDRDDIALDFDALGFDAQLQSLLREVIARPHGIVLVTGPTGSGKTTTLYTALKAINTPDKKILTVEDPVEYVLQGVNQVPLRTQIGLTFASALRAFLRQDPDVLMVGEIRDRETAEIAIQAALTGHLLLSTLHTNSAAAAITRLLDMGIDDYLLTSTLHLVLGQRLVRRLCSECKEPYAPPEEVLDRLGIADCPVWFRATGCTECHGNGYKGRTTLIEALLVSDVIRSKVLEHADANLIERTAVDQGMRTLFGHGLVRVRAGETSIEEVRRVTALNS
jgi:general secretion pathway protein E